MSQAAAPALNPNTRPLDAGAVALVVLLCMSWGLNQVVIKLTLPEVPALVQATIRSCGGSLAVAAWAWSRGTSFDLRDGTLWPGVFAGLLFGLEFALVYTGLRWTTASRAVVFLYSAPFFVALGAAWLLPGDRLRVSQWAGLLLSFVGLMLAFGAPTPAGDPNQWLGDLMLLTAGVLWGATTLLVKASALARTPFDKTLLYQLVVSVPVLGATAWLSGERWPATLSPFAWSSLAFQTFWIASVTFVVWFWLVARYSASRLSSFTFLSPLCGVAAGALILGDPVTPAFAAAVALVVAGLLLVNRPR